MTKDSFEALQREYASLSRKVDECWLQYGRTRSRAGYEAVMLMLMVRSMAEELLKAVIEEFETQTFVRMTYLEIMEANHTGQYPVLH